MQLSEHLSIMVMFSSVKSQSRYKRSAYVSLSSLFPRARFNPLQFSNPLQGRNHKISQPDASMHPSDAFSPLRMAFTNATQHTSNVSLLQASVKPCCDLPKLTFPLLLLCLLYSHSNPHNHIFHTHRVTLSLFQFATTTDYY